VSVSARTLRTYALATADFAKWVEKSAVPAIYLLRIGQRSSQTLHSSCGTRVLVEDVQADSTLGRACAARLPDALPKEKEKKLRGFPLWQAAVPL